MSLIVAAALGVSLVALFVRLALARRAALRRLGARHLLQQLTASVSPGRRIVKQALIVSGVVLVALALARPQFGYRWEQAHRRGVDLLFAVDTSKSMLTADVKPNRLERAKLAVRDLVEHFPDDRVGLVAFAGSAFLQTPLTLDHAIFEQSLDALDTSVSPLAGTNLGSALETAQQALSDDAHRKVLVLLTDGEDLSGDALAVAERAAKAGLVVYPVGVGTPRGELIPVATAGGQTEFVKDEHGQFVTSKLDESLLRQIASATGGAYRALGDNGGGLESLYREELSSLPRSELSSRSQRVPIERFQWPLGLGLLLLAIEPLIGERRRVRGAAAVKTVSLRAATKSRRVATAVAASTALLCSAGAASASPQSAERAYQQGNFARAQQEYARAAKSKPGDPRLDFNWGAAAYKGGDLETAKKAFESALRTDDLKLQQRTYYNLGDALYRTGERTLAAGKTEDTIKSWKRAISDYESALRLDAADADAKHNLEFVKRKLAELEQKQDQQKQDQQKQDQQKQDQQKQENSTNPSNSGKNEEKKPGQGGKQAASGTASNTAKDSKSGARPRKGPGHDGEPKQDPRQARESGSAADQPPAEAKEGEAAAHPGELSKADARALLDSLRGELQVKPDLKGRPATPALEQPQKDW